MIVSLPLQLRRPWRASATSQLSPAGPVVTCKQGLVALACATGAAIAFIAIRPHGKPADPNDAAAADRLQVRQVSHYEPPLPPSSVTPAAFSVPQPALAAPAVPAQAGGMPAFMPQGNKAPPDPLAKARHAGLFVYSGNSGMAAGPQGGQEGGRGAATLGAAGPNELAARLQATPITGVTATVLRHQPYLLTQGTVVDRLRILTPISTQD